MFAIDLPKLSLVKISFGHSPRRSQFFATAGADRVAGDGEPPTDGAGRGPPAPGRRDYETEKRTISEWLEQRSTFE